MATRIIKVDVLEQYIDDYSKYGIYIIRTRVLPSYIDGLKLVHRRIVWSAYKYSEATTTKQKSARIYGDVIGRLHPHGDTSVYDAMKVLNNWWECMIPLLEGRGNWGTIQGNEQAAGRYTESRLSDFSIKYLLGSMKEIPDVVDWIETYTGTEKEPEYLDAKVPLLLINGTFGIGLGMRSVLPKHNPNQVIDAAEKLLDNPNYNVVIPPDQCTPCDIINTDFKSICNKGHGTFKVRGRMEIVESIDKSLIPDKQYIGKPAIKILSTPDLVTLNSIHDRIEKMVDEKKLPQVIAALDCGDEKHPDKMEYVVILKKGADPKYVMDMIYKNTSMENTVAINFEVLDDTYNPLRMSYTSYLQAWIESAKVRKFRYYANMLQKVKTKFHEKDAYIRALQSGEIDKIIAMIKNQKSIDDNSTMEYLISRLKITDLQAKFIINSSIKSLSMGYLSKYIQEATELKRLEDQYMTMMLDENLIKEEIRKDFKDFKSEYGRPRNCAIIDESVVNAIPNGEFKIIITEKNFIKKVSANETIGSFRDDRPVHIIKGENVESILLFDELGKVFKLPIHKVPISDRNSNGIDIRLLIKKLTSNICTVYYEPVLIELTKKTVKHFVVVQTRSGNIKKMDIEDFLGVTPSGIFFVKLDSDDIVKDITIVGDNLDIITFSKNKALRMNLTEIPHQRRATKGVKAMNVDEVDGVAQIRPNTTDIIVVTANGYINRFDVVALPQMGRAKAGSKVIKLGKTDYIKFIFGANTNDCLYVYTKYEKVEIPIVDISSCSSISGGTKMIGLKNGDSILRCNVGRLRQQ